MATFQWDLQGNINTVITAVDKLKFTGGAFDEAIRTSDYNDGTFVEDDTLSDKSAGNAPNNNKFISQAGGTGGDSQVDVGAGTVDLDSVTQGDCALKINFSDPQSVTTTNAIIYAYDGTTEASPPVDIGLVMAEQGDTNWVGAEGSGSALSLTDQTTATSHDFFILISGTPDTVGEKTGKLKLELTYS